MNSGLTGKGDSPGGWNQESPVISFIADKNFEIPLTAALCSAAVNLDRNCSLTVFVVDGGISDGGKGKIARTATDLGVTLNWIRPTSAQADKIKTFPVGYVGRACYYKLFIPEILGKAYPRIIYLDCDAVVEGDLSELWNAKMDDFYLLAVQDLINPFVSSPFGLRNWQELGRAESDGLFNSGLLVFNTRKWVEEDVSSRLANWLKSNYYNVRLCDQDAMNAVLGNKWGRLDLSWNVLPRMQLARNYFLLEKEDHEKLLNNASLLHFCGPDKPWNVHCRHPHGDRFFHYLDMTSWEGWRPKSKIFDPLLVIYYWRRVTVLLRRVTRTCRDAVNSRKSQPVS